ncbi:MAG: discoidin domain-containing protein [Hymenobacter sp.]
MRWMATAAPAGKAPTATSQDITVDLGAQQYIDRIRLTWENAYGKDFTLQVSSDQISWTTVASVTNNATTVNEYSDLAAAGVRYVKMAGTARASTYGYSLNEFEVFNYSNSSASTWLWAKLGQPPPQRAAPWPIRSSTVIIQRAGAALPMTTSGCMWTWAIASTLPRLT